MLDPGIKREEGYFVYDSGCKSDVWIKAADGTPFVGTLLSFTVVLDNLCRCLFGFGFSFSSFPFL